MGTAPQSRYPDKVDGRRRIKQPYELALARKEAAETRKRDWKLNFLREYSSTGNVTKALKAADVDPAVYQKARREDEAFREAFEIAHRAATDKVLEAVWEMGVEGQREPIIWQGEIVGYTRHKDFRAAKFLLETYDPGTYSQRERVARMGMMQADQLNARREEMLTAAEQRLAAFIGPRAEIPPTVDAEVEEDDDGDD